MRDSYDRRVKRKGETKGREPGASVIQSNTGAVRAGCSHDQSAHGRGGRRSGQGQGTGVTLEGHGHMRN